MKPDRKVLSDFLNIAGRLLPEYAGRRCPDPENPENYIYTAADLDCAIDRGVIAFTFRPVEAGLVVLDVDTHEGKENGFQTLQERRSGLVEALQGSTYTETPSGGMHVYLRFQGTRRFKSCAIWPGVEVKHAAARVTAPGSIHPEKGIEYKLTNSKGNILSLASFPEIRAALSYHRTDPLYVPPIAPEQPRGMYRQPGDRIDFIIKTVTHKNNSAGRQDSIFRIAQWARREGFSESDILGGIMSRPVFAAFAQESPHEFRHAVALRN